MCVSVFWFRVTSTIFRRLHLRRPSSVFAHCFLLQQFWADFNLGATRAPHLINLAHLRTIKLEFRKLVWSRLVSGKNNGVYSFMRSGTGCSCFFKPLPGNNCHRHPLAALHVDVWCGQAWAEGSHCMENLMQIPKDKAFELHALLKSLKLYDLKLVPGWKGGHWVQESFALGWHPSY